MLLNTGAKTKVDEFYNRPLCANDGYLTIFQRQKLREKRNNSSESMNITNLMPKVISKKRSKISDKSKTKKRRKVSSDGSYLLQCTVSGVVNMKCDLKNKKFFKNRSPKHLQKTKFTLPLNFQARLLKLEKQIQKPKEITKDKTFSIDECKLSSIDDTDCNPQTNSFKISDKHENENSPDVGTKVPALTPKSKKIQSTTEIENFGGLNFEWPSDEVLMERQNKARAMNNKLSLKDSEENFDSSFSNESSKSPLAAKKLYSIFINAAEKRKDALSHNSPKSAYKKGQLFKDTSKNGEQLIIDAGQKEIGATVCKSCYMIYCKGQEEDERLHLEYHMPYLKNLKFPGWTNETVIGSYEDGRVILVKDSDKNHLKKVEEVLYIANRDLGFYTKEIPKRPNIQFLLFISDKKRVCGCIVAEAIKSACPIVLNENSQSFNGDEKESAWKLGNWYASSESVPAICGINRIWVSQDFRRKKVASRMVDCLRKRFLPGHEIGLNELAFTDPSTVGRDFAASYTGTDFFLVYK